MAMHQAIFQQNDNHAHIDGDHCPTCDQPVPNEKFKEIHARIEADKRERAAAMERRLKEQVAQEKALADAQAKIAIEEAQNAAAAEILKAKEEVAAKEAAAGEAARKQTEAALSQKMAETEQAKIDAQQQLEVVKASKEQVEIQAKAAIEQIQKNSAEALAKAKEETTAKEAAAREATKQEVEAAATLKITEIEQAKNAVEQQLQAAQTAHEAAMNLRLLEQREILEKAKDDAVNVEKSKAFNDNLKLQSAVQELTRKLEQKTADELGEAAELDLFEALRAEFPDDQIRRVDKGAPGVDIIHSIVNNGMVCGTIVYDCKNRNAWRNDYVEKLRKDQMDARADFAVLSTRVFPAGVRHLHIQDEVILVSPARTVVLSEMLRKQIIQNHVLRLSNEARSEKTAQLYDFIRSERCTQLLGRIETLTDDMGTLDVKEKKEHDSTWKRRGELIRSVQRAHGDFSSEIDRIIGTAQIADAQA